MAHSALAFFSVILLVATGLSGCFGFGSFSQPVTVEAPDWHVGDTWVYARTGASGEELIYERKVNARFMHGANLVWELKSGLRSSAMQDYHLYRTDDLRFVGSDLRAGSELIKRVTAEEPLVYHYVFPLVEGAELEREGLLEQSVGSHEQSDPVTVKASVGEPRSLTLGERTYEVVPYELRIEFQSTPFEEEIVIQGNWAEAVGQSVLTIMDEGGERIRYELLYFEHQEPAPGAPAYDLVPPLSSRLLERGFEARLTKSGWERHLFHVEDPVRVGVSVTLPRGNQAEDRLDVVSMRPLGFTRAGIADQLTDVATGGLFLHVSASDEDGNVEHHAAQGANNDRVFLQPGQVYELILASNEGDVHVRLDHTQENQALQPVERGRVEVLSGVHEHVQEVTDPGPQSVSEALDARIDNPDGERVEGIAFVVNHGGDDESLVEFESRRKVILSADNWAWEDEKELYAYYFGYVPRDGFRLRTGYEYQATMALQGMVDYEMGVLLLKLLPP